MPEAQPTPDPEGGAQAPLGPTPPGKAPFGKTPSGTLAREGESGAASWAAQSLSPVEFAKAFERESQLFWYVAAGVLGGPGEAEDVLQEAALIALGKLDQFQRGTSFQAWMAQIVRFVALNHMRKRAHQSAAQRAASIEELERLPAPGGAASTQSSDSILPDPALPRETVLQNLHKLEDLGDRFDDRVLAALRRVGETARTCLLLRTVSELEYREIAQVLEIPEGTAMSHVHRARAAMRGFLGGCTSGAALDASGRALDGGYAQ